MASVVGQECECVSFQSKLGMIVSFDSYHRSAMGIG